jgi:hypothetical protein
LELFEACPAVPRVILQFLTARAACLALFVSTFTIPAVGQTAAAPASAEDLYKHGVESFEAGDYPTACRLLAESYRIDPRPGALFTLATCDVRAGRIATAAKGYTDYLELVKALPPEQQAQQEGRRAAAEQERASLLPDLPYLKIVIVGPQRSAPDVSLNGAPLSSGELGVEIPVDPGEQTVEQRLGNGQSRMQRVVLAKRDHYVLSLLGAPAEPPTHISIVPSSGALPPPLPAPPSNKAAYVIGAVGFTGLAVGAVAGVLALGNRSVVQNECAGLSCSPKGKDAVDAGRNDALVSSVGFGVGAIGLGVSALLFLRSPSPASASAHRRAPSVALTPRALVVSGVF